MRILRTIWRYEQFALCSVDVAFESVCFPQFEKDIDVFERSSSRSVGIRGLKISYMPKLGKLDLDL